MNVFGDSVCCKSGRIPSPSRGLLSNKSVQRTVLLVQGRRLLGRGERRNPDTNFRGAMDVVICIFALSRPPPPTPAREGRGRIAARPIRNPDVCDLGQTMKQGLPRPSRAGVGGGGLGRSAFTSLKRVVS
jgi:hypothetical protein